MRKLFMTLAVIAFAAVGTASAAPLQLAFVVDSSGSIGSTNFNLMRTGIANAVNNLMPTNGSVELTIVRFGSSASTIVAPTVINNAGDLASVVAAINGMTFVGGTTNLADGISTATNLVTNSPGHNPANTQIFNVVTDGVPNVGSPNGQQAAINARNAAMLAGIDELSAEFIGNNPAALSFMQNQIVFPGPGVVAPPFVSGQGFVYPVDDFGQAFEDAFSQKLRFIITENVPEPMSVVVFGALALGGVGTALRRRKAAKTVA